MTLIRTPDQRVRVFVSSVLKELAKERAAAKEAIERLRLTPVLFELGARPHPPRDLYRAYLEQSHIFVGIYWQEYGWVGADAQISGLEDEYLLAAGMPTLMYLREPAPDRDPRLAAMLDRLRADSEVSYKRFSTPEELSQLIQDDVALLLSERFEGGKQRWASGAIEEQSGPVKARTALPTGTVTFLFTDIEGSTRLLQEVGTLYPYLLNTHRQLLRGEFEARGGREVSTEGDSLFVVFPNPADAVAASVAAQRRLAEYPWPEGRSLKVRMGLHTGEGKMFAAGYVGLDVHRAARIGSAAHGGQILVSETTQALVKDAPPDDVGFRDLGEHRLKDLARPQRLFQVVAGHLPGDFPPLRSLTSLPNNLPLQLTRFIGREREMAEIKASLTHNRLVTMTGSGGAGKTRLALQVAADLLEEYEDGVWLVELAPISDSMLAQTVASVLSLREQPGRTIEATLIEYLGPRQLLIVLDNCEHLLRSCASLAESMLRACAHLRLLATSREGLGIAGELTHRVPSLAVPQSRQPLSLDALAQTEAVRLFVDRATFAVPAFRLTERNAAAVAMLCTRLDGIPLAIELAASRTKGMSVEQITARLDDRFRLLTGGSRTALPRHQTLRAALDWSYELLTESERTLLRRLSVFAGGWTMEAAEAVGAGDGIDAGDVLELLMHLVDKSLVLTEGLNGATRYRFLDTVREYARDQLSKTGEAGRVGDRHRDWFLDLAQEAEPHLAGPEQAAWLDRLETEHHNLRVALGWCKTGGAPENGLRLAAALWRFWHIRGYTREGREWLGAALSQAGNAPPALRTKALFGTGVLAWRQEDAQAAAPLVEESLALARALGDKRAIADSLRVLAMVAGHDHDYDRALALGEESLSYFRELQDVPGISAAVRFLAFSALMFAEFETAVAMLEESLKLARAIEDKRGVAWSLYGLAEAARMRGDYSTTERICSDALSRFRNVGEKWGLVSSLECLGLSAMHRGDYGRAEEFFGERLRLATDLGNKALIGLALYHLGLLALNQGDDARATRLQEESHALLQEAGERWIHAGRLWTRVDPLCALGVIALRKGDFAQATAYLDESLAFYRTTKNRRAQASALHHLGVLAHRQGDGSRAKALHAEGLAIRRDLKDRRGTAESLEGLAAVAVSEHQLDRAATLFAAADALREAIGAPLPPAQRADYEGSLKAARTGLGEQAFGEAWIQGRGTRLEQAIAYGMKSAEIAC